MLKGKSIHELYDAKKYSLKCAKTCLELLISYGEGKDEIICNVDNYKFLFKKVDGDWVLQYTDYEE